MSPTLLLFGVVLLATLGGFVVFARAAGDVPGSRNWMLIVLAVLFAFLLLLGFRVLEEVFA